jgi:hypothetical protein
MTKEYMRAIIVENGHLVLEGKESKDELHEAILHLWNHRWENCRTHVGTPIEALVIDIRAFKKGTTGRHRKVENVQ